MTNKPTPDPMDWTRRLNTTSQGKPLPTPPTEPHSQTYEAVVLLRVELLMLAGAEVFSGTFSSNIGRIVALMRETLNKPRGSTLSADTETWFAG